MAYTQADLDRVKRAIARGELAVQYADRRVKFRSFAELQSAQRLIASELAAASSPVPRPRITLLRHRGKGA